MLSFSKIRHFFLLKKTRIVLAIFVFILEAVYLAGPLGRVGEDRENFLSGEGSWGVEDDQAAAKFIQEFRPSYRKLNGISLLFFQNGQTVPDGDVTITICDQKGNVLTSRVLSYSVIRLGTYTDINNLDLSLNPRRSYYLTVDCQTREGDAFVNIGVCSSELPLPENRGLYYAKSVLQTASPETEIDSTQLVIRFSYSYAITPAKRFLTLFLCFLTALGIAFGLPQSKRLRIVAACILMLLAPVVLGRQLETISLDSDLSSLLPNAIEWCCALMLLTELCFLLSTFSFRISIIVPNVFYTFVYCVDYFVRSFRGTPLKWNDIAAYRTAARVMGGYHLSPNGEMAMAWCILVLFVVYALSCGGSILRDTSGKRLFSKKIFFAVHSAGLFLGIVLLIGANGFLLRTDFLDRQGFLTKHTTDDYAMYQSNGFLISTYLDIRSSKILPPAGYSKETAQELLREYENGDVRETGDLPHILLILNESFSDLRVLGNLQISEENMPFFKSLTENVIRGTTYSSVLGGGTANAEFEVFTGCTMGFFPRGYFPYMQLLRQPVPSLVSDLKQAGYTTYSMHPELATNWNRYKIYPYLGFDHSLWLEDFSNADMVHGRVSDRTTYDRLEEIYENRQENEKLFLFDLTMQNHGGYNENDSGHDIRAVNVSSSEADTYLSLMKESDEALKELITYFSGQDEKVLICLYGDHQPKFYDDDFYNGIYQQTEGLTQTDILWNQYKTPFIIWANYDIPEEDNLNISMNYLGVLLLKTAGLEQSAYFHYLEELMKEYPVINANGYMDRDGNFYEWETTSFPEYRILQYYMLKDA